MQTHGDRTTDTLWDDGQVIKHIRRELQQVHSRTCGNQRSQFQGGVGVHNY